jgi:hypothetical protein
VVMAGLLLLMLFVVARIFSGVVSVDGNDVG